ncbi:MAG: UDP-N-acetylmuramate--L-alanine ligase, partial [Propionibacteriaceae bacterium]|nr:UDP-N-acetylmuramate--L-alanine ligase [Propionibacteriaceae bacterium]
TTGLVIACFQPHLYTRTRDFATELGQALAGCDHAVILDVYPARELPIPGVSGELVAAAARAAGLAVTYVPEFDQAVPTLARLVRSGDLVITLGAGNVTNIGSALARFLQEV